MRIVEKDVLCCFKLRRLTLGIGNFMSSHSLSVGHVPLGLGRDNKFVNVSSYINGKSYVKYLNY